VSFFFQAEDGIRDPLVTGVQRVLFRSRGAVPLRALGQETVLRRLAQGMRVRCRGNGPAAATEGVAIRHCLTDATTVVTSSTSLEIGRASCRERGTLTGASAYPREERRQ